MSTTRDLAEPAARFMGSTRDLPEPAARFMSSTRDLAGPALPLFTLHSSLFTLHCSSNHHSSLIAHDYLIQLEFRQTQHLMHNASYLFVDGCVIRRIGDLIALVVARQV